MWKFNGTTFTDDEIKKYSEDTGMSVDEYVDRFEVKKDEEEEEEEETQEASLTLQDLMPTDFGKNKIEISDDIKEGINSSTVKVAESYNSAKPEEKFKLLQKEYEPLGFTVSPGRSGGTVNISNNKGKSENFKLHSTAASSQGINSLTPGGYSIPATEASLFEDIQLFTEKNKPESTIYKEIKNATKQEPDNYAKIITSGGPLDDYDNKIFKDELVPATPDQQLDLIEYTRGSITDVYNNPSIIGLGQEGGVGSDSFDSPEYDEEKADAIYDMVKKRSGLDISKDDFLSIYDQTKQTTLAAAQQANQIKKNTELLGVDQDENFLGELKQLQYNKRTPKEKTKIRLISKRRALIKKIKNIKVNLKNPELTQQQRENLNKNINKINVDLKDNEDAFEQNAAIVEINAGDVKYPQLHFETVNKELKNTFFNDQGQSAQKQKEIEQQVKVNTESEFDEIIKDAQRLNPNLSQLEASQQAYDNAALRLQVIQSDATNQTIKVNVKAMLGNNDGVRRKLVAAGYAGDNAEISLFALHQLGIDADTLDGSFIRSLKSEVKDYTSKKDLASLQMYEETFKETNRELDGLYELVFQQTDPASIDKASVVRTFAESAVEAFQEEIFGKQVIELDTSRKQLDRLNEAAKIVGIKFTEDQLDAIKMGFFEEVAQGVGQFMPMVAKLGLLSAATGGVLGATGALKVLNNLKESGLRGKALYHAAYALIEEAKLQSVGFKPGGGIAFYGIGAATSKIGPSGKFKWAKSLFDKGVKPGPSGMLSLEVAGITELAYDDFMDNKDFKAGFEELYGDMDEVAKRMVVNNFVFSILGASGLRSNDFKNTADKMRTQRQLGNQIKSKIIEMSNDISKSEIIPKRKKGPDGKTTTPESFDINGRSVSKKVNDKYLNDINLIEGWQQTKKSLEQQTNLEKLWGSLDPNGKDFEKNIEKEVVQPFRTALENTGVKADFEVILGEGKDFRENNDMGGSKGIFNAKENKVYVDKNSENLLGVINHEIGHAVKLAYMKANPASKQSFVKNINKIFKGTNVGIDKFGNEIKGERLEKEVEKVYSDYTEQQRNEEFLFHVVEQVSNPDFYYTNVAPGAIGQIKQEISNFLKGSNLPQTPISNGKQLVDALAIATYNQSKGITKPRDQKLLTELSQIDLLNVQTGEAFKSRESLESREITSENIETAKENKRLFDKIGEKSTKTVELESLIKKLKNDSKNLTGEDLLKKERTIKKVEEDLAGRELADAALVKEEILENNRGLITNFVKSKFIDGLGISRSKFTQGVELEIRDKLLTTYSKDKGEIGSYLKQALFGEGGFGGGRLGDILKNSGQEGDLFNKSLDSKEAQSKLVEEIIPENIKKTASKIDLAKKRDKKEQEVTIKNLDTYLKQTGRSIEDMYRGNMPDLNQAATEKMLGLKPGALNIRKQGTKPRQLSQQELRNVQNKFTADPSYYRRLLPPTNVVPLEAKGKFKGRSLNLGQKVLQAFYEITDKRSSGEKSQPYIYKLREEFKGISSKADAAFLKQIGKVKGEQAIVDPRGSTGSTTQALARKVGEFITNKVVRDRLVNEPNNKNIIEDIAAGGSNSVASKVLFRDKSPKEIENFRKIAKLIAKGEIDKAQNEYPYEFRDVENFLIESKIEEVLALKTETPTFKKLVSQLPEFFDFNGEKISKEEIFSGGIGTGMVSTKDKVYKIYDKARIEQQLDQAASWARTLPPELKQLLTKNTLLQSLGLTQATTGMNVQSKGKKKDKLTKEGKKVYKDPFFTEQANRLYNEIGKDYKGKEFFSKDLLNNIAEKGVKGIDQQKNAFKKYLETGDVKDLKKAINESDNAQKVALYDSFQNSLQDWLYNSTNKQEFINKSKYIFQSAASNTNLIMGFGRQFVPVEAVLMKQNSTLSKLKIEHAKTSLKQSMDAATAVVEGRYNVDGTKISKDYTGFLSYKKYLDVIDNLGGTTNLAGRDRMVLDFENLKNYATVASGFKKSLYNEILENAAKEFNTNTELLKKKYLVDQLSSFGLSKTPVSKVLLKTAIDNAKQYAEAWRANKILAKKSGIENVDKLSPLQLIEKLKQKDKTNQEELIESYASRDLDLAFNEIIEIKTGIGKEKNYSKAKAAVVGAKSGKINLIASSAQDFEGLMYRTLGKGKVGDMQKKFYEEFLYRPLARAEANLATDRVTMASNFKALKKQLKVSPKDLRKNIEGQPWSKEQAVRVHIWNKQGAEIPNLSKTDLKLLNDFVKNDPKLEAYAQELVLLGKGTPYAEPGQNWEVGSITSDLIKAIQTTKRSQYLAPFQSNVDIMFSEKNLNKLEAGFGSKYREALENSLARIRIGKNRLSSGSGNKLENRVLDYVNNSVGAIMFFNTRSAALQTLSAVNFLNFRENNPLAAGKAFANQPQYWKDFSKLMNSDYLVDRRQGIKLNVAEAEIADAVHDQTNKAKAALNYILKKGFLPTQFADSFAIASGGATYYRNRVKMYEKEGLSTKEAEKKAYLDFMDTAEKSQQSSKAQRISMQQASNLGRVVLAFANTPSQYLRLSQKAASDLANGRGTKVENISKLAYYSVVQNLMFTTLQRATVGLLFDDDEDDKAQAKEKLPDVISSGIDNLARGAGVAGAVLVTAKAIAMKVYKESKKKKSRYTDAAYELLTFSPPIRSKVIKLRSAGSTFDWDKKEIKEKGWSLDNPAYLASANIVSAVTNVPIDRVIKKIDNLKGAMDEQNADWQRVALLMGWSEWELGIDDESSESAPKLTSEEKLTKLTKVQQVDSLLSLGITKKQIRNLKLESDRVRAILNPKSIKIEKLSERDSLFGLNKKQQVEALLKQGFTKKEIRALKLEDDRVSSIMSNKK